MTKHDHGLTFFAGLKDALPICFGYFSVSLAFGMIAADRNMPLWAAVLFAATCVSGTGQFVGLNLLAISAELIECFCTLAIINARYLLMSVSLSQKMPEKMPLWQRLVVAYGNTDELFALASTQTSPLTFPYMTGMIVISVSGWLAGTILGEIAGGIFPQSLVTAMNIALYAMYIALIIPDTAKSKKIAAVVLTAVVVSCLLFVLPGGIGDGWRIIIAGTAAAALGAVLFPRETEEGGRS